MDETWKIKKHFIKIATIFIIFVVISMIICIEIVNYINSKYEQKEATIKIYGDKAVIQFEARKGLKTIIKNALRFKNLDGETITIYSLDYYSEKIRFSKIDKTPIYVVGIVSIAIFLFEIRKYIDYYSNLIENGAIVEAKVVTDTNLLLLKWENAEDKKTYYFVKRRLFEKWNSEPKEFMDVCINVEDPKQYYIMEGDEQDGKI